MKHLKTFESIRTPQIDDYILTYISEEEIEECGFRREEVEYLNNNLCKVIKIREYKAGNQYQINLPKKFDLKDDDDSETWIFASEIIWFDNEYMDPEIIKNVNKYNL